MIESSDSTDRIVVEGNPKDPTAQDDSLDAKIGLQAIEADELAVLMNEAIVAVETHAPGAIPVEARDRVSPDEHWTAPASATPKKEHDPYVGGLEGEVERLRNKCQSLSDDFDRFRKRSRDQSRKQETNLVANLVSSLLPLLDNMERAAHAAERKDYTDDSLREGLVMVHEQFLAILREVNVFEVDTKDSLFDPENHEAVQQLKSDDLPDGTISDVNQKGFRIGKRLIRPARVVVIKNSNKKEL